LSTDILVVDDETDIRDMIAGILEDEGYHVRTAADGDAALAAVRARKPDLVVLDVWLEKGRTEGLGLLEYLKSLDPKMPVIMISGHGTIETAVGSIRRGAYDFLEKPFKTDRLLLVIERALETSSLKRENDLLKGQSSTVLELIGNSNAINQLKSTIARVGPTNSRILIMGPPGSGKELIARTIHTQSTRAKGPFVAVSSASIDPDRMETELFGEEAADGRVLKVGLFEQAHNGTLLLDEIADMPAGTQSKILRVLVDQKFKRLNGKDDVRVDTRVISTTSRDLPGEIARGTFREDLYYRLNVVPLLAPPLSERREDIPELVQFFSQRICEAGNMAQRTLSASSVALLQAADWPGNVRQLRNMVERILIMATSDPLEEIHVDRLPGAHIGDGREDSIMALSPELVSLPLREARECFERDYLRLQINRFGGNISRTASFIGMERSALHRKLKSLSLESDRGSSDLGDA